MTYTITVCKYGSEIGLVTVPTEYIKEEMDYSDVDEHEYEDSWVCVQDARVIVEDAEGNVVYDDVPDAADAPTEDATTQYNDNTYLTEVGWRTQTYESETLPTYKLVDFGQYTALCLASTEDMEFCESWDGRYAEATKTTAM